MLNRRRILKMTETTKIFESTLVKQALKESILK